MKCSLDIVIVNWNSGTQLCDCLESIRTTQREGLSLHVVVVDNASRDGSADDLEQLALPLTVLRNQVNRGFGAACNQGARGSGADYLLFLNPDIRLYPTSLAGPVAFMERVDNTRVGICGIQLVDETGAITRSCARFPTPGRLFPQMLGIDRLLPAAFPPHLMTDWDHQETRPVDQVMGAFFLVRRSLFEALEGFDERFFVYYEDVDFAYRARQAGWSSHYLADCRCYHKGRGTTDQIKATRLVYALQSRMLFGYKHFNKLLATGLALGTLCVEPLARLAQALIRRSWEAFRATLQGYTALWCRAPRLLGRAAGLRSR